MKNTPTPVKGGSSTVADSDRAGSMVPEKAKPGWGKLTGGSGNKPSK
jgi:hypothetical protein